MPQSAASIGALVRSAGVLRHQLVRSETCIVRSVIVLMATFERLSFYLYALDPPDALPFEIARKCQDPSGFPRVSSEKEAQPHRTSNPCSELPDTSESGDFLIHPEESIGQRLMRRKKETVQQFLIKWCNSGEGNLTWEDGRYLRKKFPKFHPLGQGSQNWKGIIMNFGISFSREENGEKLGLGYCEVKSKGEEMMAIGCESEQAKADGRGTPIDEARIGLVQGMNNGPDNNS